VREMKGLCLDVELIGAKEQIDDEDLPPAEEDLMINKSDYKKQTPVIAESEGKQGE